MSALDLDSLRGRWAEQGRAIDAGMRIDGAAMRAALDRRTQSARRRQLLVVGLQMAGDGALLAALVIYMLARLDQPAWLLMATGFAAPLVAHFAAGLTQWRLLRALDLAGPVPAALATMATLRTLRLRLARMIVVLGVLLWWPMLLLLVNALSGVDLLRWLHWSVLWGNVIAGVVFVPLAWALMRWLGRRYGERPGLRGFLDETAGQGWMRLRDDLVTSGRLAAVGDEDLAAALPRPLPAAAIVPLRALRRRLGWVVAGAALAMLAIGGFNMLHGGEWQFIAPGILLNLVVVAQLAFSIENRVALARCVRDGLADADALAAVLPAIARQRRRLARVTLALAPLWLPALAQVLAAAFAGRDLAGGLAPPLLAAAVGVLAGVSAALLFAAWRRTAAWPVRLVAAAALGVPAAADRARSALG
jgi:hypothetical protein